MLIGYLGWGSLVWDPRDLPIRGCWFKDGPFLPIEFARQSQDDRITLVIVPGRPLIRSLWAICSLDDLNDARDALGEREGMPKENFDLHLGIWNKGQTTDEIEDRIGEWAKSLKLDAIIWTKLLPKFNKKEGIPTVEQVVSHLSKLRHEKRKNAERYVRMAPLQIDTDYRRCIEKELHWTPLGEF